MNFTGATKAELVAELAKRDGVSCDVTPDCYWWIAVAGGRYYDR